MELYKGPVSSSEVHPICGKRVDHIQWASLSSAVLSAEPTVDFLLPGASGPTCVDISKVAGCEDYVCGNGDA